MSILARLFGKKSRHELQGDRQPEQTVLVYLRGSGLPDHVYRDYDLGTIQDQLRKVIAKEGLGEFDGNSMELDEAILYMYGQDAERLFSGVEATLLAYPLCEKARVVIRRGGPGAEQREVRL